MRRNPLEELNEILISSLSKEEKKERILQYHESDIAAFLNQLSKPQREELLEILGDEVFAEILSYAENVEELIEDFEPEKTAQLLGKMDVDDAIDVLEELEEDQRKEVESYIDEQTSESIEKVLQYEDDHIGSRMTDNYISVYQNDTIKNSMKQLIHKAADHDNISLIYVLQKDGTFYGVIELRDLIIAREYEDLEKIIKKNYPFFYATEEIENCLPRLKEYALESYPILDEKHKLLGVITSDDVIEAVDDEFGDDYAKFAGLTEAEEINDTVFESVKKRLPWLIILLILGLFQSFAMTGFERVVAALPVIVFFQTLVLDMSGNSGTQSLAVTIRLLSDKEERRRKILKTIFKELKTGFFNGLALGILAFIIVFIFMLVTKQSVETDVYNVRDAIKASGIISISLLIAMTVSSFVGAIVPILFVKIHIDPAVASGPFITTINDITALLIYYGLAYIFFMIL